MGTSGSERGRQVSSIENEQRYKEVQQRIDSTLSQRRPPLLEELQVALNLIPAHVWYANPSGAVTFLNERGSDYLGLPKDHPLRFGIDTGAEWDSHIPLLHPADHEETRRVWSTCVRTGCAGHVSLRVRNAQGGYRCFLSRAEPVRASEGTLLYWLGVKRDIEDRKQGEDRLHYENAALREEIDETSMFEEIVGTSPALQSVLSRISKVAPGDSTVLITGETGTGKELVARAIHRRSNRSSRAFVSVNCAAIPRDLILSELFGHERGAFTGATQRRLGRFELADGGTIFLDEVGELLPDTQVALLRVLQEREFERVGGGRLIRVDVRVIAATNRDLKAAVANGAFREDLYYRLNVFPIEMPALRARRADIPLLVEYFIDRYARKAGKNIRSVDKKTLQLLQSYPWPGNIRELQNVIERSVIVCETETFIVDESWLSQRPLDTRAGNKSFL